MLRRITLRPVRFSSIPSLLDLRVPLSDGSMSPVRLLSCGQTDNCLNNYNINWTHSLGLIRHRRWASSVVDSPNTSTSNSNADDAVVMGHPIESSDASHIHVPLEPVLTTDKSFSAANEARQLNNNRPNHNSNKLKSRRLKQAIQYPLIDETQAGQFYDDIAKHLSSKNLRKFVVFLNKRRAVLAVKGSLPAKMESLWSQEHQDSVAPEWVRAKLLSILMGKYNQTGAEQNPVPLINRQGWEEKLEVLMQAREFSTLYPLAHKGQEGEKEQQQQDLADRSACHQAKSPAELRDDAERLFSHLADTLPQENFDKWLGELRKLVNSAESPKSSRRRIYFKYGSVYRCIASHFHLVAGPIAEYFYLRNPEDSNPQSSKAKLDWEVLRGRFMQNLQGFQKAIMDWKPKQTKKKSKIEDEGLEVDLSLKPLDEAKLHPSPRKRLYRVSLDAMLLTDVMPTVPHSDRMVFVDNLPIDVTEMELFEFYSRCGPIDSIKIFNQRPDLDPGPLTGKELRELQKKERMNRNATPSWKWKHPKTPLYGLITFATQDGFDGANDSALKLFGMVVRRHAMRSWRALDFNKLYVDNLPKGLLSADLEYQLMTSLKANDIYICLDIGQRKNVEPTSCEITFPSFEVAYTCFDKVCESIEILRDSVEGQQMFFRRENSDLAVNWLPTPEDAMQYWTREKGF